ncbi:MAG TPA: hypothetical protein VKR58_09350, partial [Aquella sp.]|nr:hypothetical protein [Aquella sp.]
MKHKFKKNSLIAASLLLITACTTGNNVGGGSSSLSSNLTNDRSLSNNGSKSGYLKNNYEVPARLGYGFDDRTGMSEGLSCLVNADDPSAIVLSNPQGSIDFTDSITAQEV